MGRACGTCVGVYIYIYIKGLLGNHEELRTLGRHTSKWEDNIKEVSSINTMGGRGLNSSDSCK